MQIHFNLSTGEIMNTTIIIKMLCIVTVLVTSGITEENTVFLRGKVISSDNNGQPVDSVIVRLLNNNLSVYTAGDGSFVIGDRKVAIRKGATISSAHRFSIKNGALYKHGGFPNGARITLYDLRGKQLETITYKECTSDLRIDIPNTAGNRSWSGNVVLSVTANTAEQTEYYCVTRIGRQIASLNRKTESSSSAALHKNAIAAEATDTLHLWKPGFKAKKVVLSNLIDSIETIALDSLTEMQTAPAPLFRDPVCNGAADPTIIWNHQEKAYWIFYTNRRVNCCQGCTGVQWVFGTDIGIASTFDGGATWQYRGIAKLQGKESLNWNDEKNTFWAVEVICHDGMYHMYASITPGVLSSWNERIAGIVHLSAENPLDGWKYDDIPYTPIHQGIDATVHKLDDGKWYLWGKFSDVLVSDDLVHWNIHNSSSPRTGEAPYVFYWKNYYWIIWDPTGGGTGSSGLTVKRSSDGLTWTNQKSILEGAGIREGENGVDGKHCSVVVQKDNAYIIYFAEIGGTAGSCLQAAPLEVHNGVLSADRNTPFEFILEHHENPMNEGR